MGQNTTKWATAGRPLLVNITAGYLHGGVALTMGIILPLLALLCMADDIFWSQMGPPHPHTRTTAPDDRTAVRHAVWYDHASLKSRRRQHSLARQFNRTATRVRTASLCCSWWARMAACGRPFLICDLVTAATRAQHGREGAHAAHKRRGAHAPGKAHRKSAADTGAGGRSSTEFGQPPGRRDWPDYLSS